MTERISALSSLLASAFPLLVYWGTISVPNSMGYIFFLGSLYFCLKYLSSRKSKIRYLMVLFSFASFLSHFLTGIMSFAFILLAISLKRYEREKAESPLAAKFLLAVSFVFSASLIPLASIYNRIFSPSYAYFSLEKIQGLHATDLLGLFLFGEYLNYSLVTAVIHIVGPLIGLGGLLYTLDVSVKHRCNYNGRVLILFLFLGFLVAFVDYRILKLFMMNMPFNEERIWVFRDFTVLPFVAFALSGVVVFISKVISRFAFFGARARTHRFVGAALNASVLLLLVGWIVASVYVAYPRYGPLQITSYELEAVKYIERTTNRSYIVVGDQWIAYAGLMFVGIYNPEAYYFSPADPRGVTLFITMKNNPTNETLVEAMKTTNATVAYFVIEKPRLAEEDYNRITQQAEQNDLQTYPGGIFYYKNEEKLHIFYYQGQLATG